MASSKDCNIWKQEKTVQEVKQKKGCSFFEARKIVEQTSNVPGTATYADAAKKSVRSIGIQVDSMFLDNQPPSTSSSGIPFIQSSNLQSVQSSSNAINQTGQPKTTTSSQPNQTDQAQHQQQKSQKENSTKFSSANNNKMHQDLVHLNQHRSSDEDMEADGLDGDSDPSFNRATTAKQRRDDRRKKKKDKKNQQNTSPVRPP